MIIAKVSKKTSSLDQCGKFSLNSKDIDKNSKDKLIKLSEIETRKKLKMISNFRNIR